MLNSNIDPQHIFSLSTSESFVSLFWYIHLILFCFVSLFFYCCFIILLFVFLILIFFKSFFFFSNFFYYGISLSEFKNVCRLPVDHGYECDTADPSPYYYFDSESNTCRQFNFKGCGGNKNLFKSMTDCDNRCEKGLHPGQYFLWHFNFPII